MKYRVEHTKKEVQAIGAGGCDTKGIASVTIVWDDEANIGVEYETPYFASAIVSNPDKGTNPFRTAAGREHAKEIAAAIEQYVKDNKIFD